MSFDALQIIEGPELQPAHDAEIDAAEGFKSEHLPQEGEEQPDDFLGGMDAGFDDNNLAEHEEYKGERPSLL